MLPVASLDVIVLTPLGAVVWSLNDSEEPVESRKLVEPDLLCLLPEFLVA